MQELESNGSAINAQIKELVASKERFEELEKNLEEQTRANEARIVGVEENSAKLREEAQEKV